MDSNSVTKIDNLDDFAEEYPRVRDWIKEALTYNDEGFTERQLLDGIAERHYQVWTSANAVCVTSIVVHREKRTLVLFLVGGHKGKALRDIFVLGLPVVEKYARDFSCEAIMGIGRPQWGKYLSRYGFEIDENNFYKDFANG